MTEALKPVSISPSQVQTFLTCPRKWWFQSVQKMPDMSDKKKRDIGTALHSCAERWLKADDTGRIDGQPVDPFPDKWWIVQDYDGSRRALNFREQSMVRRLFDDAITRGVLRRLPGRQIEAKFTTVIVPGVVMNGVIDQDSSICIEDHKTTGRREYALSKKKLIEDPKMLCYAAHRWNEDGRDKPVTLRLNYFCKDTDEDPPTWSVEESVSSEDVREFWLKKLVPTAFDVIKYRAAGLTDLDWIKVEGPRVKGACTQYGGCPYAKICGGMQSPERHRTIANKNSDRPKGDQLKEKRTGKMGLFGKKRKAPTTSETAPAEVVQQDAKAAMLEEKAAAVAVAEPEIQAPPWHVKACMACKKTPGINSKGEACRACDVVSGRNGGPTSSQYVIGKTDNGMLTWTKTDGAAKVEPKPKTEAPAPAPIKLTEAVAAAVAQKVAELPPVVQINENGDDVVVPPAEPAKPAKVKKPKATKPAPQPEPVDSIIQGLSDESRTFTLYINCYPTGVDRAQIIDLATIIQTEGAELASVANAASYYEMHSFNRKDALASQVAEIAKGLRGYHVVALGSGQEMKSFLDALRPYANGDVIQGVF